MLEGPQQDATVAARVRSRPVARQPDRVAPPVGAGGVRTAVRHRVAHLDLGAIDRLRWDDHIAGDQIGWRERIDVDRLRQRVVAIVRELVDGVARIRTHDDEAVATEADRNLQRLGQRAVALVGIERRAVGDAADQQITTIEPRIERQVDVVPPLPGGRHRAAVHDVEGDLDRRTGCGARRHGDRFDLQIGARVRRQRHRLIVDQCVVCRCVAVLVERTVGVGGDLDTPDSREHRHREAFGARVRQPRTQAVRIAERAQRDRRCRGVAKLAQHHPVGPCVACCCVALVRHRPGDLDRATLEAFLGRHDVADHQVRARRQCDAGGPGKGGVVVGVDELERPTGGHEDVVIPGESIRQIEQHTAVIARARRQRTEVVERPAANHPAAIGVGCEIHRIGPGEAVGAGDADVVHTPAHRKRATRLRARRSGGRADLQVRVAIGHHVEDPGRAVGVVRLEAVLEHDTGGVTAHEQCVAPGETGRQDQGFTARIALADGEETLVREARKHDVVTIAGDGVARGDDRVHPLPGQSDSGTLVAHRPADGDVGGVGNRLRRGTDTGDHQIRIRRQRHRKCGTRIVVGLGTRLAHRVRRVAAHDDPPATGEIDRQRDGERAIVAFAHGKRAGVCEFPEQQVPAADQIVLRQVDAIDPGAWRRTRAGVLDPPADGDRIR